MTKAPPANTGGAFGLRWREGFLLAVANAEGTYYRYMKAWLKGRGGQKP